MKLENFISSCRHRLKVVKENKTIYVNCGRCSDCIAKRSRYLENLCKQAAINSTYVYFVTLTYNEANVPKLQLFEFNDELQPDGTYTKYIVGRDLTSRPLKTKVKHFSDYKSIKLILHNTSFNDEKFNDFYIKANTAKDGTRLDSLYPYPVLRYVRNSDVTNFIKRLRFSLSQICDDPISYFACSEYGPQSFRPHFHLLLYFSSRTIAENIKRLCHKSWQLGNVDSSFARNGRTCANYCASYLNSFTSLPIYLRSDDVKPKSFHSRFFGSVVSPQVRDYFYEDVRRSFAPTSINTPTGIIDFVPTSQALCRIFPRCYNYEQQDRKNRLRLYNCFSYFSNIYESTKCSELARFILIDNDKYLSFLSLLDIYKTDFEYFSISQYKEQCKQLYPVLPLRSGDYYRDVFSVVGLYPTDEDNTMYSRLYFALLLSRNFFYFCCEKRDKYDVLDIIDDYYNRLPLFRLSQQYRMMKMYNDATNSEDYRIFFYETPEDKDEFVYQDYYNNSSYIKSINVSKDLDYQQKIKHKILNDANKLFC